MEPLILASASPRRRDLLDQAGIPYEVCPAQADESCSLPAKEAVAELSLRKALAALRARPGRYILAADTLVTLDGEVLGKPKDEEDACRMLRELSGRTHQVCTGVTVVHPEGRCLTGVDVSDVIFAPMTEAEIREYVASGEPMDKAGAYAVQGRAALWIRRLEGSPSCVTGLPLRLVRVLLEQAGYFA